MVGTGVFACLRSGCAAAVVVPDSAALLDAALPDDARTSTVAAASAVCEVCKALTTADAGTEGDGSR